MSFLNGLASFGTGLSAFAGNAVKDEDARIRAPLLNSAPPSVEATPPVDAPQAAAPVLPGPRMPSGVNPYGDNPHAAALWLAERAIVGPESGGRADAQNPVSSAGGLFQIINPTWDAAMGKLGMPIAQTEAERNQQKYLPELNTRAMRVINTDAAAALSAQGLPVNVETLQAAHRLGPGGAAAAIKAALADPTAPLIGNGLSASAVRGNGDISHLTVGEFLARPYPRSGG